MTVQSHKSRIILLFLYVLLSTNHALVLLPHKASIIAHNPQPGPQRDIGHHNSSAGPSSLIIKFDNLYQAASIVLRTSQGRFPSGSCELKSCAPHAETLTPCAAWTKKIDYEFSCDELSNTFEIRLVRPVRTNGFNFSCAGGSLQFDAVEVFQDERVRGRRRDAISPLPIRIVPLSRLIPGYTKFDVYNAKTKTTRELTFAGYTVSMTIAFYPDRRTRRGASFEFHQYTSTDLNVKFETTLGLGQVDLDPTVDRRMYEAVYGIGNVRTVNCVNEDGCLQVKNLSNSLIQLLSTNLIRGIPVIDVMRTLYSESQQSTLTYPIAVVGGTVRDLINGKDVNDVDIAISKPYTLTAFTLNDFFNLKGAAVAPNSVQADGVRSDYGMIKVDMMAGDSDSLDVGIMKSDPLNFYGFSWGDWESSSAEDSSYYLYGFSYRQDSRSRDYTINAVYMDPVGPTPKIIDPSGTGFDDIINQKVRLIPGNDIQFTRDYGGWFRFFKEAGRPGYTIADPMLARRVCGYINDKWVLYSTGFAGNETTPNAPYFFLKLRKKLFPINGDVAAHTSKLNIYRATITSLREPMCVIMWNNLVDLCNSPALRLVIGGLSAEIPDDYARLLMIQAIAKQPYMDIVQTTARALRSQPDRSSVIPLEKLVSLDLVDQHLQQMLCQVSDTQAQVVPQMPLIPDADDSEDDDSYGGSSDFQGFTYPLMTDWEIDTADPGQIVYANKLIVILGSWFKSLDVSDPFQSLIQSIINNPNEDLTDPISFLRSSSAADIARFIAPLYEDHVQIAKMLLVIAPMSQYQVPEVLQITDQFADVTFRASPTNVKAHRIVLGARLQTSAWDDFGVYDNYDYIVNLPLEHVPSTDTVSVFLHFVYTGYYPKLSNPLSDSEWLDVLSLQAEVMPDAPNLCTIVPSSGTRVSSPVSFLLLLVFLF